MAFPTLDVQSGAAVSAIMQAAFTAVLALLWWANRRMRGLGWLAVCGALNMGGSALGSVQPAEAGRPLYFAGSVLFALGSAATLVGLRWFARRTRWNLRSAVYAMAAITAGSAVLEHFAPGAGTGILRLTCIALLLATVVLVTRPRMEALRPVLRVSAVVVGTMALLRVFTFASHISPGERFAVHASHGLLLAAMTTMLDLVAISLYLAESRRMLEEEVRMDALTGLRNRRALEESAGRAVASAADRGEALAALMLDMDSFKALNDTHGHALGDTALEKVGAVLLGCAAQPQHAARLGGEEFAVLLPGRTLEQACEIAEEIRLRVESLELSAESGTARVTVSIGVSTLAAGERDWRALLHRADVALYRAKREGRNRVETWPADLELGPGIFASVAAQQSVWTRYLEAKLPVLPNRR